MIIVDIVLILAILGFIGGGIKDGFVQTAGRFVGALIGFALARTYAPQITPIFDVFLSTNIARLVAFLLIFFLVMRILGFFFKLADGAFRVLSIIPFLKPINSLLGGIVGFFEGFVAIGGTIYLILTYAVEPHLVLWLKASVLAGWILAIFKTSLAILL